VTSGVVTSGVVTSGVVTRGVVTSGVVTRGVVTGALVVGVVVARGCVVVVVGRGTVTRGVVIGGNAADAGRVFHMNTTAPTAHAAAITQPRVRPAVSRREGRTICADAPRDTEHGEPPRRTRDASRRNAC
jgi:hypothetical protein